MSPLIKWDPFEEMQSLFEDPFRLPSIFSKGVGWDLAVDVYEDGNNVIAEMAIPAVDPGKVDVSIENNVLRLSGSRAEKEEKTEKNFYSREIRTGRFERVINLPTEVDSKKAKADYRDGVLRVTMPKKEATEVKKIKVKVNS